MANKSKGYQQKVAEDAKEKGEGTLGCSFLFFAIFAPFCSYLLTHWVRISFTAFLSVFQLFPVATALRLLPRQLGGLRLLAATSYLPSILFHSRPFAGGFHLILFHSRPFA